VEEFILVEFILKFNVVYIFIYIVFVLVFSQVQSLVLVPLSSCVVLIFF